MDPPEEFVMALSAPVSSALEESVGRRQPLARPRALRLTILPADDVVSISKAIEGEGLSLDRLLAYKAAWSGTGQPRALKGRTGHA